MHARRRLALLLVTAAAGVAACGGGGDGYGCTGRTCTATFDGTGEQDLSAQLGRGATVTVAAVDEDGVTVRIGADEAQLGRGEAARVAAYDVQLTKLDGDAVTLRVLGD